MCSLCTEGQSTTLGLKGRQTYEPSGPKGPVNPKNLFHSPLSEAMQPFYTTRGEAAQNSYLPHFIIVL